MDGWTTTALVLGAAVVSTEIFPPAKPKPRPKPIAEVAESELAPRMATLRRETGITSGARPVHVFALLREREVAARGRSPTVPTWPAPTSHDDLADLCRAWLAAFPSSGVEWFLTDIDDDAVAAVERARALHASYYLGAALATDDQTVAVWLAVKRLAVAADDALLKLDEGATWGDRVVDAAGATLVSLPGTLVGGVGDVLGTTGAALVGGVGDVLGTIVVALAPLALAGGVAWLIWKGAS